MIVLVIQFVYRYLFVISEQAQHMRLAARARSSRKGPTFQMATGALGVLFARSWERAEAIHSSMLARGFQGRLLPLQTPHWHLTDVLFFAVVCAACLAIRFGL